MTLNSGFLFLVFHQSSEVIGNIYFPELQANIQIASYTQTGKKKLFLGLCNKQTLHYRL